MLRPRRSGVHRSRVDTCIECKRGSATQQQFVVGGCLFAGHTRWRSTFSPHAMAVSKDFYFQLSTFAVNTGK